MKILLELSHPKHYHQFKHLVKKFNSHDETVTIIARKKDVLFDLLEYDKIDFNIYGKHGKSIKSKFTVLPEIIKIYKNLINNVKPDVIISKASPYGALLGKLFGIRTIITPDSEIVTLTNKFVSPLSSLIITPQNFELDFGKKHKRINSFFETTYLHPKYFTPNKNMLKELNLSENNNYIVVRFIGWNANHDLGNRGFTDVEKETLVNHLSKYGQVIITAEGRLPVQLEKLRLKVAPSLIHHLLSFATLYIGDSQTMATEAALLGVPSIRYNSFVGENDMSNFKLLQDRYKLLYNCQSVDEVISKSTEILEDDCSSEIWNNHRNSFFSDVGDTTLQMYNIINEFILNG